MTEILINIITATENILILCDNQYIKSSLIEKTLLYNKTIANCADLTENKYDSIIMYNQTEEIKSMCITSNIHLIKLKDDKTRYLTYFIDINISKKSIFKIFTYLYGLNNVKTLFYDVDFYDIFLFADYFCLDKILCKITEELKTFNIAKYSINFFDLYTIKIKTNKEFDVDDFGRLKVQSIFKEYKYNVQLKNLKKIVKKKQIILIDNYFYEYHKKNDNLVCDYIVEKLKYVSLEKMILLMYMPDFVIYLNNEKIDLSYVLHTPVKIEYTQFQKNHTELFTSSDIMYMLTSKCNEILGKVEFYVFYNNLINTNGYPLLIYIEDRYFDLFSDKCSLITQNYYEFDNNVILTMFGQYTTISPEAIFVDKSYNILISNHTIINYIYNATYIQSTIYNNLCNVAYIKYDKKYDIEGGDYYYILKKMNRKIV